MLINWQLSHERVNSTPTSDSMSNDHSILFLNSVNTDTLTILAEIL